jgi:fumarate reductase subunit D
MTLQKIGGLAALLCAATYLFGLVFLVTVLAPLGFGSGDTDASAVVAFIDAQPGLLIVFNIVIYILNAFALAVLVVALDARLKFTTPETETRKVTQ